MPTLSAYRKRKKRNDVLKRGKRREKRLGKRGLLLFALVAVAVMQEDEAEDKDTKHHGEGTGIVRER